MSKKKVPAVAAAPTVPAPTPALSLAEINAKFARLKEVNAALAAKATLYAEKDTLERELLPLFILQDKDTFLISREITVGTKTHRFTPGFFDVKKGIVMTKTWKSAQFPTGVIETIS